MIQRKEKENHIGITFWKKKQTINFRINLINIFAFSLTRQNKAKMTESLFVMASHGVLLEYTLETLPDVNNKDNICESSPIKLQVCYTITLIHNYRKKEICWNLANKTTIALKLSTCIHVLHFLGWGIWSVEFDSTQSYQWFTTPFEHRQSFDGFRTVWKWQIALSASKWEQWRQVAVSSRNCDPCWAAQTTVDGTPILLQDTKTSQRWVNTLIKQFSGSCRVELRSLALLTERLFSLV